MQVIGISIQESFEMLMRELKVHKQATFKGLCNEAGYNARGVYNMLARGSLRCDVLEDLLDTAGYKLAILPKDEETLAPQKELKIAEHKSADKINNSKEKTFEKLLDAAGYKMAIVTKDEEESTFENVLRSEGYKLAIVPDNESKENLPNSVKNGSKFDV